MPTRKPAIHNKLTNWLLRSLLVVGQRSRVSNTGFVLPTVVMVSLVVVLLTAALVIRSFDRSKNASNARVNEVVLNAATPALDRAKAKLVALLDDPGLPRSTPSDIALYNAIANNLDKYTLGDEKPLKILYDIDQDGQIETTKTNPPTTLENSESLATAWRFPVDTDNNGKFDSYTLYGVYFRSPTLANGQPNRERNPLEARTKPMDDTSGTGLCAAATGSAASLVGTTGWYKTGSKIKKSFFVYSATVPISNPPAGGNYEKYKGNKGFSAIEYQQDLARIPLSNSAVVYEDDLEISPGPDFRLNGRITTNSNLLTAQTNKPIRLYQVSSKESCYYDEESAKIVVGGNVGNGTFTPPASGDTRGAVTVDLFQGAGQDVTQKQINSTNQSTSNSVPTTAYNSSAYTERINLLVEAQLAKPDTSDPSDVKTKVASADVSQQAQVRRKELEIYFRNRTRRVPFYEVPSPTGTATALGSYTTANVLQGSGDTLRPPDAWSYPTDPANGTAGAGYTGLTLKTDQLETTDPEIQKTLRKEPRLGDRIRVGNNLPFFWWLTNAFVSEQKLQLIQSVAWSDGSPNRGRFTRVRRLDDLGITDRNGFWEQAAAAPFNSADLSSGGLRVITGAGVYERKNSFLPPPKYDNPTTPEIEAGAEYVDPKDANRKYPMVWPDTMPMSPGVNSKVYNNVSSGWVDLPAALPTATTPTIDASTPQFAKGDLRMRAAAVYHYTQDAYTGPTDYQSPIACVSSYYDPTNNLTARNPSELGSGTDVSGEVSGTQPAFAAGARSNNGIVYGVPSVTAASLTGVSLPNSTTDLFSGNESSTGLAARLQYQANLKFPNGRFVNEALREALIRKANNQNLTLREQSAIDSTICSFAILDGSVTPNPGLIPHGAVKETTFLDGRQVKALSADNATTPALETFTNDGRNSSDININPNNGYDLPIEQRQPLEVRATALDMNLLRTKAIGTGEFLLPNSGVIYASRDDALPDLSDDPANDIDERKLKSAVDFKLDPTRRPNGILLFNGEKLWRTNEFRETEKGLILATDLPTYVYGPFNLHTQQEFKNGDLLADDWGNFYDRRAANINKDFACRKNDPRLPECTTGDEWRPATVLADAVTLLSGNFRFGFRNEGDYDLANNNGSRAAIKERLRNGFWNNNFVTNGLSSGSNFLVRGTAVTATDADYSGNSATAPGSSYFNNFVTPVQRRVNFPTYIMEICRKLPVAECQAADWVVGFDRNGDGTLDAAERNIPARQLGQELKNTATALSINLDTNGDNILSNAEARWPDVLGTKSPLDRLGAGTTAKSALVESDRRFPRRVAFARDIYNALVFTEIGNSAAAKPMGVGCPLDTTGSNPTNNGCQYPTTTTSTAGVNMGILADNALWFRTTNTTKGRPFCTAQNNPSDCADTNDKIAYASDEPLYYVPPEQGGSKLILPDTPCFTGTGIVDCKATDEAGTFNLNLPKYPGNPSPPYKAASDYTICMTSSSGNAGTTNNYESTGNELQNGARCPGAPNDGTTLAINNAYDTLRAMADTAPAGTLDAAGGTFTASRAVNIVTVPDFDNGAVINLNAGGQTDPIFVIKGGSLHFGANCTTTAAQNGSNCGAGIKVNLNGVNPNNVFWALSGAPQFENVNSSNGGTVVSGNFIGSTSSPSIGTNVTVNGGRFLGFQTAPTVGGNAVVRAITADAQPLLAPVLQLQNTTSTPSNVTTNSIVRGTQWLQRATETTFNLVSATGDTPARVDPKATPTTPTEDNGGLHNFVRFLETWNTGGGTTGSVKSRISGSFIQLKRSNYATAPWLPVISGFTPPSLFDYTPSYVTDNNDGQVPYYTPPTRQWGFDVALLSQLPDLFSQRFTVPPAGAPNEFFREVGRDDAWVKSLLCASVGDKTAPNTYTYSNAYAADSSELPVVPSNTDTSCRPLNDYTK
jgi:hypothetical protein